MFTGIITDLGRVRRLERSGDTRIEITTGYDTTTIAMGASIACNGCCLTVVETGPDWFAVQASGETLLKTTLGGWTEGKAVNLERALALGAELGGHIVSGHVDGIATVIERRSDGESTRFVFEVPETLKGYVAGKGSVALDGVSLTVNEVDDRRFGVNIIPHTTEVTTFGGLAVGDTVNFEIDMLARYVARLLETRE
ncbi:riboflavin synthase [Roseospira marina]|uniref:Riboflavin synthase n=1 Tax=Roseospira marina TaxID=140057 RepID=A0A5M6I7A3_9PROT|nr:riboflavin synthase [Roseospira marina]KAA5604140.1 riboflavin synthase [Roseospira marina]MBB4315764.1 riboflavin synthase [Roseospira marina]